MLDSDQAISVISTPLLLICHNKDAALFFFFLSPPPHVARACSLQRGHWSSGNNYPLAANLSTQRRRSLNTSLPGRRSSHLYNPPLICHNKDAAFWPRGLGLRPGLRSSHLYNPWPICHSKDAALQNHFQALPTIMSAICLPEMQTATRRKGDRPLPYASQRGCMMMSIEARGNSGTASCSQISPSPASITTPKALNLHLTRRLKDVGPGSDTKADS